MIIAVDHILLALALGTLIRVSCYNGIKLEGRSQMYSNMCRVRFRLANESHPSLPVLPPVTLGTMPEPDSDG